MFVAIFPFIFIVGIVFFITYNSKQNKQKQESLLNTFSNNFTFSKEFVKTDVFTSGRKNNSLIFNSCHLYVSQDMILLLGYKDFGVFTINTIPVLLTNHPEKYEHLSALAYITKPKKFNPYSYNEDVYIEFGESGWQTTSVDIRLLKLTNEEKEHILFLQ